MNDYNFWADFLDTFQTSPDWIKAVWLLIPPGFLLAAGALILRYRLMAKRLTKRFDGRLVYSVVRGQEGQLQIYRHPNGAWEGKAPPAPIGLDGEQVSETLRNS